MSGKERMRAYEKKLREMAIPTTRVSGSGRVNVPGIGEIHVSGSGFISQEEIRISGSGRLPGGIKVGKIRSSGSVSIDGEIEADEMSFSGSAAVAGPVKAKSLSFSGSCAIGKAVELEDSLRARGSLKVSGDLKANNLVDIRGCFEVEGKLIANTIEAELNRSKSYVRNGIEAVSVDVRKGETEGIVIFGFPLLGKKFRSGKLSTTDIVAKERIYIENVSCDNVIGGEVTIGEGCVIRNRVKYSYSITVHPTASLTNPPEKVT